VNGVASARFFGWVEKAVNVSLDPARINGETLEIVCEMHKTQDTTTTQLDQFSIHLKHSAATGQQAQQHGVQGQNDSRGHQQNLNARTSSLSVPSSFGLCPF
jgi:multidrug efflux pump subunit AcrB